MVYNKLLFFLLLVTVVCSGYAGVTTGRKLKKTRPFGVTIFGILLIAASVKRWWDFQDYSNYVFMFQQLPPNIILIRYGFSIFLRIVGLMVGIGILMLRNSFRVLGIGLCFFTIVTIYWKHPYDVFYNTASFLEQSVYHTQAVDTLLHPWRPRVAQLAHCVADIGFALAWIYYFTRKSVKQYFT